jgi:hypothetical protein
VSDVVDHLARLINRVTWNENTTAEKGFSYNRDRETAALLWALDFLSDEFPDETAEAMEVARRRSGRGTVSTQRDRG